MTDLLAGLVCALLSGLAAFQVALALGAPLGHLAWGGKSTGPLPPRLRLASVAALVPIASGLVAAAAAAGWLGWPGRSAARTILFALAALFALSAVGNAASSSAAERRLGLPLAAALAAGCLALALSV